MRLKVFWCHLVQELAEPLDLVLVLVRDGHAAGLDHVSPEDFEAH